LHTNVVKYLTVMLTGHQYKMPRT